MNFNCCQNIIDNTCNREYRGSAKNLILCHFKNIHKTSSYTIPIGTKVISSKFALTQYLLELNNGINSNKWFDRTNIRKRRLEDNIYEISNDNFELLEEYDEPCSGEIKKLVLKLLGDLIGSRLEHHQLNLVFSGVLNILNKIATCSKNLGKAVHYIYKLTACFKREKFLSEESLEPSLFQFPTITGGNFLNAYGFSLKEQMFHFLSNSVIQSNLVFEPPTIPNTYANFLNGSHVLNILKTKPNCIFYTIYTNDFNIVSRSFNASHSLCVASFLVLNIAPKLRSKLSNSSTLIINDISYQFSLFLYISDNKELLQLRLNSFQSDLSSVFHGRETKCCRICICKDGDYVVCLTEKKEILRPCTDGKYLDWNHDFYLGRSGLGIICILQNLVENFKMISLESFNASIKETNFMNNDKPYPLSHLKKLKQNASQSKTLLLWFPILLRKTYTIYQDSGGPSLSDKNYFEVCNFISTRLETLRQIGQIVDSYTFSENVLVKLDELVKSHLNWMVGERGHLLPKEHNLIHISSCIRRLGPISQISTLRFESTHQQIKRDVNVGNNRVNIGYTASTKNKLRFSLLSLRNFDANVPDFISFPDNFILMKKRELSQSRNIINRSCKTRQISNLKLVKVTKICNETNSAIGISVIWLTTIGCIHVMNSVLYKDLFQFLLSDVISYKKESYIDISNYLGFIFNDYVSFGTNDRSKNYTKQLEYQITRNIFYSSNI